MEFLRDLFICFYTVFKQIFREKITINYPEQRVLLPDNFRGSVAFDSSKCCGCRTCQKYCPAVDAIKIDGTIKSVNLALCANCGNCVYSCPNGVIYMTKKYELATSDINRLLLEDNE